MEGRMFKVSILMDNKKILKEGKYPIKDIYYTIEKNYKEHGFERDYDLEDGSMVFYGTKGAEDFRGYADASYFLQEQDWFMHNVKKWLCYENMDCAYSDEFDVGDYLKIIKEVARTVGVI